MFALTYIAPLVAAAYTLFFLYDWRLASGRGNTGSLAVFGTGCILVVVATAFLLATQLPWCPWDALSLVFLALALVSAALMIKALFFSLPAHTYTAPGQARHTYARGMYALCRHPGVLWYCLMFASLAIMLRTPAATAGCCILCIGDIAYMVFQDVWSFPRIFCDYAEYQRNVPFFLPTRASVHAAFAMDGSKADGGRA